MALTEKHFKNIFIYLVPRFLSYGLHLLTLPIITRILSPEDFGVMTLAMAVPAIAVSVATAGLTASVPRYYFEYRKDSKKLNALFFSTQMYLFLMLLLSSVVIYLTKDHAAKLVTGNSGYGLAVFIAFIAAYFGQINTFYLRIYQNMEKAVIHSTYVVMQVLISVSMSLLLVWYYRLSYMGMLYGSMAGALITCIVITINFNKKMRIDFSKDMLIESIKYGLQVVPKSFTGLINRFFDKYMLNAMLSMSVAGVFSIGQTITGALEAIMGNIWMSFQPVSYKEVFDKGDEASSGVGRIFTIFSYISLLPVMLVVLFSTEIIYVIAPPAYYGAASVVVILAAGTTTQIFGRYVSIQYAYSKKPLWIFPISVVGTVFNVGANILLIPRYGLIGAGFATLVSMTIINILLTYIGQKLYRINYEWTTIIMLMSVVPLAMIFMLLLDPIDLSYAHIYTAKVFFIVLYGLIGIRAGIITRESVGKGIGLFTNLFKAGKA